MLRLNSAKILVALIVFSIAIEISVTGFGPTRTQTGVFESVSSHQVIQAKIDGNFAQVVLPRFEFSSDIDFRDLKKHLKEGLKTQDAIFHLYHDGLGSPKKQGGKYFASDIYLKELKMTYTGYLRKLGLKFTVSNIPPHEDKDHLRNVLYSEHIVTQQLEAEKKAKEEPEKEEEKNKTKASNMRVTTIWDVLPKGVIPPSIRRAQREIDARIKELKERPYKPEIVQMHPVRWATGIMGEINSEGVISNSYLEGQKPELIITPPREKNWLTSKMAQELKGQKCEFVFQLSKSGHEISENGRYFLRDIYFRGLRLSWEEWLKKHNKTFVDPTERKDFANSSIELKTKLVSGKFAGMRAAVLCAGIFSSDEPEIKEKEILRIFPPNPRPKKFVAFARKFNKLFNGANADFAILYCPDGKPYTELGQKRARSIRFRDQKATLQKLQSKLLTGKIK
jgi:hypothetical protein